MRDNADAQHTTSSLISHPFFQSFTTHHLPPYALAAVSSQDRTVNGQAIYQSPLKKGFAVAAGLPLANDEKRVGMEGAGEKRLAFKTAGVMQGGVHR